MARNPAGNHGGVVGGSNEDTVAGLHPIVLGQCMGESVGPIRKLLVGSTATISDQRGMIAKALRHHIVGKLDGGIQMDRIVESLKQEIRPLILWGQIIPGDGVDMSGWSQHFILQQARDGR